MKSNAREVKRRIRLGVTNSMRTVGGKPRKLSSSLYVQTKDNNKSTDYHEEKNEIQVLKPGMILLKNWLSRNDQVSCQPESNFLSG